MAAQAIVAATEMAAWLRSRLAARHGVKPVRRTRQRRHRKE
ncbi:hypothetical protein LTSEJOH_5688 [Salmonella enterica subsp. enterica serovar Johannesburg str. S5-703]|nr:hypothetical protein LTSEJOH_5688 [Salmonella enterica subsp. enterica serovar Johannesburg str. S5-703]